MLEEVSKLLAKLPAGWEGWGIGRGQEATHLAPAGFEELGMR